MFPWDRFGISFVLNGTLDSVYKFSSILPRSLDVVYGLVLHQFLFGIVRLDSFRRTRSDRRMFSKAGFLA